MGRSAARRREGGPRESELSWYFDDARGELGLRGINPEPSMGGGDEAAVERADKRRAKSAKKYREITLALLRLTSAERAVLALAYSPILPSHARHIDKLGWCPSVAIALLAEHLASARVTAIETHDRISGEFTSSLAAHNARSTPFASDEERLEAIERVEVIERRLDGHRAHLFEAAHDAAALRRIAVWREPKKKSPEGKAKLEGLKNRANKATADALAAYENVRRGWL